MISRNLKFMADWYNFAFQHVLWFHPTESPESANEFGNVFFVLQWKEVFEKHGPYIYLLDHKQYKGKMYSQVLLTSVKREYLTPFESSRISRSKLPIQLDGTSHKFAESTLNSDEGTVIGDTGESGMEEWLYSNSKQYATDHSRVNIDNPQWAPTMLHYDSNPRLYKSFCCFKYNRARNEKCPFPNTSDETEEKMKDALL